MTRPSYDTWRLDPAHRYGEDSVDGWAAYERAMHDTEVADAAVRRCIEAIQDRILSYTSTRAPGWGEVEHEGIQCIAACRALLASEPSNG